MFNDASIVFSGRVLRLGLCLLLLSGCSEKPPERKAGPQPVQITVTQAEARPLDVIEQTLGVLESLHDPKISAEIAGRVLNIAVLPGQRVRKGQRLAELEASDAGLLHVADVAEAAKIEALLAQQERLVVRQRDLLARNFVSQNALDDALAQRDAMKNQLFAARSRTAISAHAIEKAHIVSPVDGVVEARVAAVGDFLKVGDPLLRLVSNIGLRANLPFPETMARQLRPGQAVRLFSPQLPGELIEGVVDEIRPALLETSRALEVLVRLQESASSRKLMHGGTVDARIVIGQKASAILVPEQAVVLRPAGSVVYRVSSGQARQQPVDTGVRQNGMVEIVRGIQSGDTIALDGAGFLSDGAVVSVVDHGRKMP